MRPRRSKRVRQVIWAILFINIAALLITVLLAAYMQESNRTNSPALPGIYVPSTVTPERTIPLCVQDHNCTMNGRP